MTLMIKKPWKCSDCDFSTAYRHSIEQHVEGVHKGKGQKLFMCDHEGCTYVGSHKHDLYKHSLIHTDTRPHACLLCKKRFRRTDHLYRHVRTHADKKLFSCPVADCKFTCIQKHQLNLHLKRHGEVKPHSCKYCSKHFVTSTELKRHEKQTNNQIHHFESSSAPKTAAASKANQKLKRIKLDTVHNAIILKDVSSTCKDGDSKSDSKGSFDAEENQKSELSNLSTSISSRPKSAMSKSSTEIQKKINCMHCPMYFYSETNFYNHLREHTGKKIVFKDFKGETDSESDSN